MPRLTHVCLVHVRFRLSDGWAERARPEAARHHPDGGRRRVLPRAAHDCSASSPNKRQYTPRIYAHIQKNRRLAQNRFPVFFSISRAVVQSAHIEKNQPTAVMRGRWCFATKGRMAKNQIGYGARKGVASITNKMAVTVSKIVSSVVGVSSV